MKINPMMNAQPMKQKMAFKAQGRSNDLNLTPDFGVYQLGGTINTPRTHSYFVSHSTQGSKRPMSLTATPPELLQLKEEGVQVPQRDMTLAGKAAFAEGMDAQVPLTYNQDYANSLMKLRNRQSI